jgi:Ca2+-binding EF-hand superfamily protein
MLFRDSALLDRIFRAFDLNEDNKILFDEYLSCLATISSKASKEDKLKCNNHKLFYACCP